MLLYSREAQPVRGRKLGQEVRTSVVVILDLVSLDLSVTPYANVLLLHRPYCGRQRERAAAC